MGPQPLSLKPRLVTGTSLERFLAMQGCNLHLKQNLEKERKNFCYMYGFAMPHFPPALVPTSSERSFFQFSRCSGELPFFASSYIDFVLSLPCFDLDGWVSCTLDEKNIYFCVGTKCLSIAEVCEKNSVS